MTFLVSVVSMVLLTVLVQKTKMHGHARGGRRYEAWPQLMGIKLNHTITFTFALAPARASAPSSTLPVSAGEAHHGRAAGLKAFVAAVLGRHRLHPRRQLGGLAIGWRKVIVNALGVFPPGRRRGLVILNPWFW